MYKEHRRADSRSALNSKIGPKRLVRKGRTRPPRVSQPDPKFNSNEKVNRTKSAGKNAKLFVLTIIPPDYIFAQFALPGL
jgi:hypothetical protein